jgi:hypothetical protein
LKETIVEANLKNPNMSTLERLELLDVIPDKTVVTAKCDGELGLVVYDRNGESYTLNKWGRRRQDYPALNELIEALNKTPVTHAKFLAELYAKEDGKPLKLPQFISLVKGQDQDLSKIHLGIFDLLMLERNPVSYDYKWKMEEVATWLKGCSHVSVVPFTLSRTLQDVKDFWNTYVEGQGYEGLVIRQPTHTYKIKPALEVDAVIIGLNKKTSYGKALDLFQQGQITSIKLALMDEKDNFIELSDCASGITADLRTLLWQLMEYKVSEDDRTVYITPVAICTVQYTDTFPKRRELLKFDGKGYRFNGWTKFVSLRHPRLIRFRPDKDVNPQDLRLTQIPEDKIPKPEEERKTPQRTIEESRMNPLSKAIIEPPEKEVDAPHIAKTPITLKSEDSLEDLKEKLCGEGWNVNDAYYMHGKTPEEAVELQAKSFPCIEFQPVFYGNLKELPKWLEEHENELGWVAFHRTPIKEWLKAKDEAEGNTTPAYLDQDDKQGKKELSESNEPEPEDIGECDICHQTKHIEQLEQCEACLLIICDNCRPNHKHEAQNPKPTAKFGLENWF